MENFINNLQDQLKELKEISNRKYMNIGFYSSVDVKIELLEEIIKLAEKFK